MNSHHPISVVLVDDHVLMREGLREILETQPDVVVVGEAGDSATAISVIAEHQPRVILLDVEIPGGDVTDTVTAVRELSPRTEIIILSMYDGPHLVQRLLALGIRGYLLKSVGRAELVSAIRNASTDDGNVILSVSRRSLSQMPTTGALTPRELDVLELASRALSNAQIASRLYLTEATVKRHLSNIFAKLGAVSRIDAVNKAVAASLIPPPRDGEDRA
ncbi:MAG TPA: response regulator transcription factor [Micromonosporaceae bacterium]|nr:response regulator transcription factor [Micromonosporaceae bacterium]